MMATPSPVTIEIVTSAARLAEVGPAWIGLSQRSRGLVFQSHGWVSAWWHALPEGSPHRLRIGLAWAGERLVGAMPLVLRRQWGLRILEWAAKSCSDYCDLLAETGPDEAGIRDALWAGIAREVRFDAAYLGHLAPGATALPLLGRPGPVGLGPSARAQVNLRLRQASPDGETWFNALPKKQRQNDRRGWKILAEHGRAVFRLAEPDEAAGPILERLIMLKRRWLARTGQHSPVLAGEAAIFRAAVASLAEQGLLRLFVIELDGQVVAGTVNFLEDGALRAFFAAYDEAMDKASVGTLLMVAYIRWAFDAGIGEIDFLAGAEPYKLKFADTSFDLVGLSGARTWRGHAALAADAAVLRWRTRLPRLTMRPRAAPARPAPAG